MNIQMKIKKSTKNKIKRNIYFIIFILVLYLIRYLYIQYNKSPISPYDYTTQYKVRFRYIYDGDTAAFFDEQGNEIDCRFIGVDAPEIDQPGYEEAKAFSNNTLRNAFEIILELDPHSTNHDKYGRILAWVWVDGNLLQEKLVENNLVSIRYLEDNYLYASHLYKIYNEKNVTK